MTKQNQEVTNEIANAEMFLETVKLMSGNTSVTTNGLQVAINHLQRALEAAQKQEAQDAQEVVEIISKAAGR